MMEVLAYTEKELPGMIAVWNEVVAAGEAFPQEELLDEESGRAFFAAQTFCGAAVDGDEVLGLYILHPNNVGRCGHLCNASYAVKGSARGRGVGEALVRHCLRQGAEAGFRILQFNAVVASNTPARALYEKLGFIQLGTIPGGFRRRDGEYVDICPYYRVL